jgi:23S rRNA (uracil1939-C5)-methyltransferase
VHEGKVSVASLNDSNSSGLGFRQVNTAVSDTLTERLLQMVARSECNPVIDLYCGRGQWTNEIARRHPDRRIVGVDSASDNIAAARDEARSLRLQNVAFHESAVEKSLKKLEIRDSLCIVDPPRAGLDSRVTEVLIAVSCRQIVYVSCHPATLARDLKRLVNGGYTVTALVPMDMFPQTAHLECLVHLERRQSQ